MGRRNNPVSNKKSGSRKRRFRKAAKFIQFERRCEREERSMSLYEKEDEKRLKKIYR